MSNTAIDTVPPSPRRTTAAELVFTLTVTDDSGDSATNTGEDTVTITIAAPVATNQPPVADAGDAQEVDTGATVTLTGSATDPDDNDDVLTYSWAHTSTDSVIRPATVIPLTNADTDTATFTAPATAAELVFTLTVTDDSGDSATSTGEDTVTITVTAPVTNNQPPVAEAGDAQEREYRRNSNADRLRQYRPRIW